MDRERSNVVELFRPTGIARARAVIVARSGAYRCDPSVVNARELIFSVQAWWHHLDSLGVSPRTSDAFLDMDATDAREEIVIACANAIQRALRLTEKL